MRIYHLMARSRSKRDLKQEDIALFRETVGDVRPVGHDRVEHAPQRPSPRPQVRELDEAQAVVDMMSDYFEPDEIEYGEYLFYARPGLQKTLIRKLRRGQLRLSADIDLHGLVVDEARVLLAEFLDLAQSNQQTCVKIIHGKGNRSNHRGPVLKHMVNRWLQQRDEVLAFSSAPPHDGGTGAVYVLLRKA